MSDEFSNVTRVGLGQRLKESFLGFIIGLVLFVGSFIILWLNEGRVNLAKVAQKAIVVNPMKIDHEAQGKLISVSAVLETSERLGDPEYLKSGNYIKLVRIVEMFSWKEVVNERTEKKLGGSETRIKTYNYKKEWAGYPADSKLFKYPENHVNPPLTIQHKTFFVKSAKIGKYNIDPQKISLPTCDKVSEDYIFKGIGSFQKPQIGDVRISFRAVKAGRDVTVFGKLSGESVTPFFYDGTTKLYRVVYGDRNEAIAMLASEHKFISWMLRLVGFLMMWIGMMLFFGPLTTFLGVLPFLSSAGSFLVAITTFLVALALSSTTIILSMIFHSIIALLIILGLLLIGLIFLIIRKRRRHGNLL